MKVIQNGRAGSPTIRKSDTFTGEVWLDQVMPTTDGVAVNHVTFTPGARTFWHYHESGQLLRVTAGSGLVCGWAERPQVLNIGDVVWTPPGERHWHGGGIESCMSHLAISLGATRWLDEVEDRAYLAKSTRRGTEEPA